MVLMYVEWGGVRVGSVLCFGGLETVILSSCGNELGVLKALMNNDVWILIRETWASIDFGLNWRFFGIGFGGGISISEVGGATFEGLWVRRVWESLLGCVFLARMPALSHSPYGFSLSTALPRIGQSLWV